MIRSIIAALFVVPTPMDWVPGLGMLVLPGSLRDRRHARRLTRAREHDHA